MFANVRVIGADASATTAAVTEYDLQAVIGRAKLFTVSAYNGEADVLYLQAHDAASAPANGAVAKLCVPVYAGASGGFNFSDGAVFTRGIYLCWSTSDTTKTLLTGTTNALIDASYRKL